jgi:DtxR family Mn-dependent transcriptional regulator
MTALKTRLSEAMAEVLEALWTMEESRDSSLESIPRFSAAEVNEELLATLEQENLVAMDGSKRIRLLPEGREQAEQIIRRHRLAERLICDVLGSHVDDSEAAACEYEHLLAEGITNSICTLLGHPRFCPHNKPIPEGECCRQAREELKPIVTSCDQLNVGETARVAYLCTREHALLRRLSNLGIAPGTPLKLLQRWPSYVLQCDETEIAVEEEVARNIYVWKV